MFICLIKYLVNGNVVGIGEALIVHLDVRLHQDTEVDGIALGTGQLEGQVQDGVSGLTAEQLEQVGADRDGDGALAVGGDAESVSEGAADDLFVVQLDDVVHLTQRSSDVVRVVHIEVDVEGDRQSLVQQRVGYIDVMKFFIACYFSSSKCNPSARAWQVTVLVSPGRSGKKLSLQ